MSFQFSNAFVWIILYVIAYITWKCVYIELEESGGKTVLMVALSLLSSRRGKIKEKKKKEKRGKKTESGEYLVGFGLVQMYTVEMGGNKIVRVNRDTIEGV